MATLYNQTGYTYNQIGAIYNQAAIERTATGTGTKNTEGWPLVEGSPVSISLCGFM